MKNKWWCHKLYIIRYIIQSSFYHDIEMCKYAKSNVSDLNSIIVSLLGENADIQNIIYRNVQIRMLSSLYHWLKFLIV